MYKHLKNVSLLLVGALLFSGMYGQSPSKTVKVPPSKDTTVVVFTVATTTSNIISASVTTIPTVGTDTTKPIPTDTSQRKNLVYDANFDASDFQLPAISGSGNQWFYEKSAASNGSAWAINGASTPTRSGSGAVRFELRKSDATSSNVTSTRSELTLKYAPGSYYEAWMGFSVFLPSASYGTDPAPDIIHQIHANNGESPAFAIQTRNGNWVVAYNYDSAAAVGGVAYHTVDLMKYEKDQWVDFVYHIKLSSGTDGVTELWKNGVKIWYRAGKTQYANLSGSNFVRVGIYKWAWNQGTTSNQTVRVAYYDNVRISNGNGTYNDVVPVK